MIDPQRTYTARSAADATGLDERTIRRAIRVGELPATRSGRLFVVGGGDLASWYGARPTTDPTAVAAPVVLPVADPVIDHDQLRAAVASDLYQQLYTAERSRAEDLAREAAAWRVRAETAEARLAAIAPTSGATSPAAEAPTPTPATTTPATSSSPTGSGWLARMRRRGA